MSARTRHIEFCLPSEQFIHIGSGDCAIDEEGAGGAAFGAIVFALSGQLCNSAPESLLLFLDKTPEPIVFYCA